MLTDEQKIYELSMIWKEAEYNFAFWDKLSINWDEEYKKALPRVLAAKDRYEYYKELMRFITLLGDGHTDVSMPMDIMQDPEYYSMLPVILFQLGEDIVVLNVTEEYKDRISLYSILKKVDGMDASEYVKERIYPYIWHAHKDSCGFNAMMWLMCGRAGSTMNCTFEKDGEQFDILLTRENPTNLHWCSVDMPIKKVTSKTILEGDFLKGDSCSIGMTEDGIAVITISSFMDDTLPGKVYACFDELKKAKAYIINVRGNGGGNSANGDAIAAMFIDGSFESCGAETQVYEPTRRAWGEGRNDLNGLTLAELEEKQVDEESIRNYKMCRHICYTKEIGTKENHAPGKLEGPIVVLMNEAVFSAAEDFVDVMKAHTRAVFIGGNTAGTSGQPLFRKLESGGAFRVCTRRCYAQNGEDIYNKGFSPDIRVIPTLEDLKAGRDTGMAKALEYLRSK